MKNILYKVFVCSILLSALTGNVFAQDFIRIGITGDFYKSKIVQTFSFDLNRTEKVDEKAGKYLLYNKQNYYILPGVDVNLGEKTTSAENNVTVLMNLGKKFLGVANVKGSITKKFNKAIEFNPTYSSDKAFEERLFYGQVKGLFNKIRSHTKEGTAPFVNRGFSLSGGPFTNIGMRRSTLFDQSSFYFTGGLLAELKWQFLKKKNESSEDEDPYANWLIKISGNYYYLFSDIDALYNKDFAGVLKASIDKKIYKILYLGLTYKLGNDNPKYTDIHTLEFAFKFNY